VTTAFRVERVAAGSLLIDTAAQLHVACLAGTLTSARGAPVVAAIYRRLVRDGHSLYLAVEGDTVIGGVMVMLDGKRRATSYTASYRPWSWLSVVRSLGAGASLQQLRDLIQVMRRTGRLARHDYIVALYVDERARRLGVARSLLTRATADSSGRGVGVGVDTLRGNDAARRLYESEGFRELATTSRSRIFIRSSE